MSGLDTLYKAALWIAFIGLAGFGLGLVIAPGQLHGLGNQAVMNPATTATLGAALVGLAVILLFLAIDQAAKIVLAIALAVAILVLMRAYLMFGAGTLAANTATLASTAIGGAVAIIMLVKATSAVTPKKK